VVDIRFFRQKKWFARAVFVPFTHSLYLSGVHDNGPLEKCRVLEL